MQSSNHPEGQGVMLEASTEGSDIPSCRPIRNIRPSMHTAGRAMAAPGGFIAFFGQANVLTESIRKTAGISIHMKFPIARPHPSKTPAFLSKPCPMQRKPSYGRFGPR